MPAKLHLRQKDGTTIVLEVELSLIYEASILKYNGSYFIYDCTHRTGHVPSYYVFEEVNEPIEIQVAPGADRNFIGQERT